MKNNRQVYVCLIAALMAFGTANSTYAGIFTFFTKGGKVVAKEGTKAATKKVVKEGTEKLLQKQAKDLTARYGARAIKSAEEFAAKSNISKSELFRIIGKHGDVIARHGFSDEALGFAYKHRGAGVFFLRHPELFNALKKSTDISTVDPKVIEKAWRWGDEYAVKGSMKKLQEALTKAGMNGGVSRDFCEDLFIIAVRNGKIKGFPKGTELIKGHIGDARQGIDLLLPGNGKVRAIEFGTGTKPIKGEMSWDRIRNSLADFLEGQSLDARINLRGKGFPAELVNNPARIRSPNFPIEKYVQREIYAPEINTTELLRAGKDIIAVKLP